MKNLLRSIPLWGMALLFFACQESNLGPPQTDAIITGYDARRCMCCGGYMITLSDDPEKYAEPYFQWNAQQEYDELDLEEDFPIYVKIDYTVNPDACSFADGWIEISDLKVVEK
ncbi:MAG: hypothetical protein AB8H47_24705 [Bacteroidia bacterium]